MPTLTTTAIADGVAAEIETPADGTEWLSSNFAVSRVWFPTPSESDLEKVQVYVIALGRIRRPRENVLPTPGRETRALLRSGHRIRVLMQTRIDMTAGTRDAALDSLAAFLLQVDDYWHVAHRKVNAIAGLTTGLTGVTCMDSDVEIANISQLDPRALWVGTINLTFTESTKW